MKDKYHRLCAKSRKVIDNLFQAGKTQIEIALAVGSSQSTISKELRRNRVEQGYSSHQAHDLALERQKQKKSRPKIIIGDFKNQVEARLRLKHSPDQISGSLAKVGVYVSHETIYQHIKADRDDGGELWKDLRFNGKRHYRWRNKARRGEKIPDRVDIDKRPPEVDKRERYGDWEADLIQGASGSGSLLSVYERKSRIGKLYKLPDKTSHQTSVALVTVLTGLDVKTITYDNGLEFAKHGFVSKLLGCVSYFCKPYHSWEKGGVENYNGLVRQYFPKGSDFSEISEERLREVEEEINNRPKKVLDYETPNDHLDELKAA